MPITFRLARDVPADADVLGVPVFTGNRVGPGAEIDRRWLAARGFEPKLGHTVAMPADDGTTVVAVGLGDPARVDHEALRTAAAALVQAAGKARRVATTLLAAAADGDQAGAAQAIVEGAGLAAYRFDRFKSDAKPAPLEEIVVVGAGGARVSAAIELGARLVEAVSMARDLVNTPAGSMTPSDVAAAAEAIAKQHKLAITVLDEAAIAKERLGGLLGVAAGSSEPPRLIKLVYDPPGARASLALVGKGVTFDSGGLSIKPADGMMTMKTDMSGAATVLAVMSLLPALGPKVKVIGIVPTTENMPSGDATKPGDVLKIRNGKTVEVLNTDAEGRLILADGLSLAVEAGVDAMIDVATLTGACMVALGPKIAGLMGNSVDLIDQLRAAADRAGEPLWPLPLPSDLRKELDSEVADVKNIGGRYGGALTAGLFLAEFVADVPWAHLDIAGPARSESDDGYLPKGGTGYGVRTLVELVRQFRKPSGPDRPARAARTTRTNGAARTKR